MSGLLNLPILVLLLIAGSNKDIDKHLETLTVVARNTQEAIRSIRQGVQAIQQGLVQVGNDYSGGKPGQLPEDGGEKPKLQ
ncbi:MAG: hypothetical protein AB1374_09950 [Bacillota bacterium]